MNSVRFGIIGYIALWASPDGIAEDWPTYRHDVARREITAESVRPPFAESWVFKAAHAPRPAWGDPNPRPLGGHGFRELRRGHFDDVFHVVVADGAVYFGSSADNKVYCLDASTGQVRWTKITGGPIRLAPTVANARVFFGSDDGHVYCVDVRDGSVLWRKGSKSFEPASDNQNHPNSCLGLLSSNM